MLVAYLENGKRSLSAALIECYRKFIPSQGTRAPHLGHSVAFRTVPDNRVEQTPDPEFSTRGDMSTSSSSNAAALLISTLRGCARGAGFLFRSGRSVDEAMGRILEARNLRTQGRSQALSLIGSGAILIAAFAPLMNVPVVGAVTYFSANSELARAVGVLLVVLGILSLSFALIERYVWLYPIGFCALSIAIGTLVSYKSYLAQAVSAQSAGLFDYFTQSASKGLAGRSSLSFGFPLLIYGAVLVMLAALMRPRAAEAVDLELPPD